MPTENPFFKDVDYDISENEDKYSYIAYDMNNSQSEEKGISLVNIVASKGVKSKVALEATKQGVSAYPNRRYKK